MLHAYRNFLADESDYAKAEAFWESLWTEIPSAERALGGWHSGWFEPQPIKDGNPIFTAVSARLHRGIRVIQYEPTSGGLEIDFWLDTFGGRPTEPGTIRELVIACALSLEAAQIARKLMSSWVHGAIELTNASGFPDGVTTISSRRTRRREAAADIDFDLLAPAA